MERRRLLADAHKLERYCDLSLRFNRCGRAERWRLASRGTSPTEEAMSETSLSTPQPPSRKAARVPSPNGDEGRAGGAEGAPPEGPAPPGSLTWRTRGRSAFEGLRRASTVRSGPFTVSWVPAVPGQPPALAFAIGKRVGNAVVRNRLRRRLREAARHLVTLPPGTYLIRARPSAVALSFQEISAHLSRATSSLATSARPLPPQAVAQDRVTSVPGPPAAEG
jgi:ribonuclease P protein component